MLLLYSFLFLVEATKEEMYLRKCVDSSIYISYIQIYHDEIASSGL